MGGASKGVQALAQTEPGKAVGGLIGKIYQWAKAHPKITATAGIALLALIGTAAAIGSGGIAPLIVGTLGAAGSGAVKGGVIGGAVGAAKDAYSQIKGGAKSFKDMDYKQMGKSALKAGGKGAAIGAAVAGGTHVAGQAIAGAGKMVGGNAAASNAAQNPAGSNISKQNYSKIGGEVVTPGNPLSQNQLNAMKMAMDMGNDGNKLYGPELMKQYNAWQQGGGSELVNAAQAKASAVSEKASEALKYIKGGKQGSYWDDELKRILGGQGAATQDQVEIYIDGYQRGTVSDEQLTAYFKQLASRGQGKGLAALDSAGKVVK